MQAIETKYIPATNTRPSRIKATCARGCAIISYPQGLTTTPSHVAAADELVARFIWEDQKKYGTGVNKNPWGRPRITGQLKNGNYVHVFIPS